MIYQADIREVAMLKSGVPRLVITEPYYEEEFWPLWTELMRFAVRVDTDYLVAFSGLSYKEKHLEYLTSTQGLRYLGTTLMVFDKHEGKAAHVFGNDSGSIVPGIRIPGPLWPFQQYLPFIMEFTKPGDLVCDPFLGSLQTCKTMALWTERRFEGFDINPGAVDQSEDTLSP